MSELDALAVALFSLALGLLLGYAVGHRRGSAPVREQERQREIESDLLGRPSRRRAAAGPASVVRPARIARTQRRWE